MEIPERKHLRRLENTNTSRHPLYFITICSHERKPVLTTPEIVTNIITTFNDSETIHGWAIGKFLIMPDHIHFFCRSVEDRKTLSEYIRDLKKRIAGQARRHGHTGQFWQSEFFDHILRNSESYIQKWEYIEMNPVRAGLCRSPENWPHQGECVELRM